MTLNQRCAVLLFGLAGLLSACQDYPKDPEKTLETISGGTLNVGYSVNPPWVIKSDSGAPTGLEIDLVNAYARQVNATIAWHPDTEQNLLEALEKRHLHLVVAGLTDDSPWSKKISFTRPFAEVEKKKHVMAVAMGENAFVVSLEKFLHAQQANLEKQLQP